MKDKQKVIIFPTHLHLPHYSELLTNESEKNNKFIEDVRRRAREIIDNIGVDVGATREGLKNK